MLGQLNSDIFHERDPLDEYLGCSVVHEAASVRHMMYTLRGTIKFYLRTSSTERTIVTDLRYKKPWA